MRHDTIVCQMCQWWTENLSLQYLCYCHTSYAIMFSTPVASYETNVSSLAWFPSKVAYLGRLHIITAQEYITYLKKQTFFKLEPEQ